MLVEKDRTQPGVYTQVDGKNSKLFNFKEHKIFLSAAIFLSLEIRDRAAGGKRLRQAPKTSH